MKQMMTLAAAIGIVSVATVAGAQRLTLIHPGGGGSPHVLTEWRISGANISVEYGRPYLKGRVIGDSIVPYGEVWRIGADESTTLISDKDLTFGNLKVPAGEYTLFILPTADKWELIINKEMGTWGTDYNSEFDLGRVDMKVDKRDPPLDQHTIEIDPAAGGGVLRVEFGSAKATAPFTVQR